MPHTRGGHCPHKSVVKDQGGDENRTKRTGVGNSKKHWESVQNHWGISSRKRQEKKKSEWFSIVASRYWKRHRGGGRGSCQLKSRVSPEKWFPGGPRQHDFLKHGGLFYLTLNGEEDNGMTDPEQCIKRKLLRGPLG